MSKGVFISGKSSLVVETVIAAASSPIFRLSNDPKVIRNDIKGRILLYLQDGPMTGYDIHRKLGNKVSKGKNMFVKNNYRSHDIYFEGNPYNTGIKIAIQNLYPHLHSLRDRGLIEEAESSRDAKHGNISYKLTDRGWEAALTNGLIDLGSYLRDNDLTEQPQPFFILLLLPFFKFETLKNADESLVMTMAMLEYLTDCLTQTRTIVERWNRNTKFYLTEAPEIEIVHMKAAINSEIWRRGHALVTNLIKYIGWKDELPDGSSTYGTDEEDTVRKSLIGILSSDSKFIAHSENILCSLETGYRLLTGEHFSKKG